MRKELFFTLLTVNLVAQNDVGCNTVVESEPIGCSISNVLKNPPSLIVEKVLTVQERIVQKKTMGITKKLDFIEVEHDNQKLLIERVSIEEQMSCPPFCLEPMSIGDVQTVGELETLNFIEKLKEKQARLLVDVRSSKTYQKATIPGAINLPLNILENESKYQDEVLKLLGAKVNLKTAKKKWSFKNAQFLLIFGDSASSSEASRAIKKLLELGYPSSKLLYYRSGIEAWKDFGLTTT
ncbi:MAG: Unknown protein [uncultured Sulfurovum sp.]|uniref:Rhodanese domain-containing protein n=1 Tax=uncultured Sulfurovum sp. TaxID=269237 RepID=A0A6S6TBX9_9BACT|nr:MAG: Unknown protein [uncultured Sulfurovum sp.]